MWERPTSVSAAQGLPATDGRRGRPAARRSVEPVVPVDRSEAESSSAEEGELEEDVGETSRDVGPAAGGVPGPTQPGECDSALLPFLSPSMLSGAGVRGREARDRTKAQGSDLLTREVQAGLRELLHKLEGGCDTGGATIMPRDIPGKQRESAPGTPASSMVQKGPEVLQGSGGAATAEKSKEDK